MKGWSLETLHDIYMNTEFVAYDHILKIGESNPEFDKILVERGVRSWAIITWSNPKAEKKDEIFNEVMKRHLSRELAERQFYCHPAEGRGKDWSEDSFLVSNISKGEALYVARVGQQVAFVYGVTGEAPELIYVGV